MIHAGYRSSEPGAIKDHGHSRASLQVLQRFCLTVSFFAAWATVRHDPLLHFSGMVMAASIACVVMAVFGRARVADQRLNRWDEALAYLAIALSVNLWEHL